MATMTDLPAGVSEIVSCLFDDKPYECDYCLYENVCQVSVSQRDYVEDHQSKKLTRDDVLVIRVATGSCPQIAKTFRIGESTVQRIRQRKTWRHI